MPYTIPSSVAKARARAAALTRHNGPDAPATIAANGELAAANLTAYVERVVAGAPPLTAQQREAILGAFVGIKPGEAARIQSYVETVVATAPPVTDAQRERIAALLTPAGGASS